MVDTAPLRVLLQQMLQTTDHGLAGISRSLEDGWLRAVALTASSYTTGQSVTWVQTRGDCAIELWQRPQRKSLSCALGVDHVMASAALPFLFPAIEVDGASYGDGGIRLTEPLSPAVHLGARRIIAVSTRYARTREEADQPAVRGYPPPAQVAGVLYNAIFLDQLDGDALQMQQINRLVARLPESAHASLRHIDLLMLRPSARQRVRSRAAARVSFSHARTRHARNALERYAEPRHVPERLREAADRARRGGRGREADRNRALPCGRSLGSREDAAGAGDFHTCPRWTACSTNATVRDK
jgi:predicted acylesterase/phospholipase RssA